MKTILSKLVLLAVLITASVNLQSCSDDSGEEPNVPNLEMVCTSCSSNYNIISYYNNPNFTNAKYDGIKIISYSDFHENLIEYKYSDNKIEQYKNNELEATHSLNNGVIVASEILDDIIEYTYKNNRIVQVFAIWDDKSSFSSYEYIWENGNLVKDLHGDGYTTYDYYEYANNLPPFQKHCGEFLDNVDPLLAYAGYYGNMPKNLVKRVNYYEDNAEYEYSYDYAYQFNDNGYPTTLYCDDLDRWFEFTWTKID